MRALTVGSAALARAEAVAQRHEAVDGGGDGDGEEGGGSDDLGEEHFDDLFPRG